MRGLWWTLKLIAGLVLIGGVLALELALVFPGATGRPEVLLGVIVLSALVYWFAHSRLGSPVRTTPSTNWQGQQYLVPAPLLRQMVLCVVLAVVSLGIPLAFVRGGHLTAWQAGLVVLGSLFGLWLCRAALMGYSQMQLAGYALKLDASGVHYPGLALLPWAQVTAIALDPPRPDSERSQSLMLQMRSLPDVPAGWRGLWRASLPGASVSSNSVRLPLPTMRKSSALLDAAHSLWRRHGAQP